MKLTKLKESKTILGSTTRTKHDLESNPETSRIAPLWQAFMKNGGVSMIPQAKSQAIYGVYNDYESDVTGMYTLTLGTESDAAGNDLRQAVIPAGNYLVFEGKGPAPQCTIDAWQEIWTYFANENSDYKRAYTTDFEVYEAAESVHVYISIE